MSASYRLLGIACLGLVALGCGDAPDSAGTEQDGDLVNQDAGATEPSLIKGRVTDVAGAPVQDVEVLVGKARARTDAFGRFEVMVAEEGETRVSVESDKHSGAALSVKASKQHAAQVELAVKQRSTLMLVDSDKGGRVEGKDGFAVELPAGAFKDASDKPVSGSVEVRYASIKSADDVSAAPGRMQTDTQKGLDGYGLVEVRFYKDGQRVSLAKQMRVELPVHAESNLKDGDEVSTYALGKEDGRWRAAEKVRVVSDKVVVDTMRDEWIGAAQETPVDSCVSGRLGVLPSGATASSSAANTVLRAARARGLSLVQAETEEDGSFCLPVSPNDDWHVTTFYDDGQESFELAVDLDSSEAVGMCGGTGCKSVGDVALPASEK